MIRIRRAISGQSFWSSPLGDGSGKDRCSTGAEHVKGDGTDPSRPTCWAAKRSAPRFPRHAARARPRKMVGVLRCLDPTSSTEMPYALALMVTVDLVSRKWMADQHVSIEEREKSGSARKNCPNPEPGPRYRARPLNGAWATAPYLHNGSVPSLYWLLHPAAERPKKFCMGGAATLIRSMSASASTAKRRVQERTNAVLDDRSQRNRDQRQQRGRPLLRGRRPLPERHRRPTVQEG